jgi:hypothetical protein
MVSGPVRNGLFSVYVARRTSHITNRVSHVAGQLAAWRGMPELVAAADDTVLACSVISQRERT